MCTSKAQREKNKREHFKKSCPSSSSSARALLSRACSFSSYLLPRSFEFHPCCEKNALAASFPPLALNKSSSSAVHRSMFALFTAVMCTPNDRWIPEQSRHINTQKFFDVHFGLAVLQSKHNRLPFLRYNALNSSSRSCCVAMILFLLSLLPSLLCLVISGLGGTRFLSPRSSSSSLKLQKSRIFPE